MSPPRNTAWARIESLYHSLVELPAEERDARLHALRADEPEVAAELETLLAADDAEEALQTGGGRGLLWRELEEGGEGATAPSLAGRVVGRYRLLEEVGRGGMSVVFLAEHVDPKIPQRVAVKLLHGDLRDEASRSRFERELSILARLSHTNIARFLDGGMTEDGRPYLAMEYIAGRPIDEHCAEQGLDLEARLQLFRRVAEAVGFAHRHLVIHRDLKPSNVLVSDEGEVKLVDFGIARLSDPDEAGPAITGELSRLFTPQYASPEQVRGDEVTVATDVYQLGLLLFELLTGDRAQPLASKSWAEVERVVCEEATPKPSTVVARRLEQAAGGEAPGVPAGSGRRVLRGDLDNIVAQATRKEPERRYGSVASLLDDLDRFARGLPVGATPDGFLYRTGKLLRRHRVGAAATAAFLALGIGYAATVTWQARRLAAERDRASAKALESEQVTELLTEVFSASDPFGNRDEEVSARQLLERGVEQVDAMTKGQPEVARRLHLTLGRVLSGLGELERAEELQRRTVVLCGSGAGADLPCRATALYQLGRTLRRRGELEKARKILTESISIYRQLEHAPVSELGEALKEQGLAYLFLHEPARAQSYFEEALELYQSTPGVDPALIAGTLNNLGMSLSSGGDGEAAIEVDRRAVKAFEESRGSEHPETSIALYNLGRELQEQGRFAEADPILRRVLAMRERVLPEGHLYIARAHVALGNNLDRLGRYKEAEAMLRRGLELTLPHYDPDHPRVADARLALGRLLVDAGRPAEAEPQLREALGIYLKRHGEDGRWTALARMWLAACRLAQGDRESAAALLAAAPVVSTEPYWGPQVGAQLEELQAEAGGV